MAVPRNRHSNARKNSRRAHHALSAKTHSACANCGQARLPHRVCSHCGFYKGKSIITEQAATA